MFEQSGDGAAQAAPQRGKLGDYRFEAYTNSELAAQIQALNKGTGATALQSVVDTLKSIADDLTNTNTVLRTELAKVGVDWQSVAGQAGTKAMTSSASYTDGAQYNITDSSGALITQGDSHALAAGAPQPSSDTQKTFGDNVAGFFGHETDHAKDVEQAADDRAAAIHQLNTYQSTSTTALSGYQPLPAPPGMNLQAQAVQNTAGTTSLAGYTGGSSAFSGPGGTGGAAFAPAGGGGGAGVPGYLPPPNFSASSPGGGPLVPGFSTGVGPGVGPGTLPGGGMPAAASAAGNMLAEEIGLGAAVAGGAGAVAAGASRSGGAAAPVRGGGVSGGGAGRGGAPGKASSGLGALNEEEAAQARAAERISPRAKPGSSMMQPATDKKKTKEEDVEHVRKYAVEADDLFGDQRMVAPSVLGEDPSE